MPFDNFRFLMRRQLVKQFPKPPPDLPVDHLLPALGDENDMIFALPLRRVQAPIGRHSGLPRSLRDRGAFNRPSERSNPEESPGKAGGLPIDLLSEVRLKPPPLGGQIYL